MKRGTAHNQQWRKSSVTGFTFIEAMLVMTIIAIVFVIGARYSVFAIDAKKYGVTYQKMIDIRRAIVGDERLYNLGVRADFGYFGETAAFPAAEGGGSDEVPTTALTNYFPPRPQTATYVYYKMDEWGNNFNYDTAQTVTFGATTYDVVEILCYGKDGSGGGGNTIFDENFHVLIRKDFFEESSAYINVMDLDGTVLRGGVAPWDHQIYRIRAVHEGSGAAFDTTTNDLGYGKGLFTLNSVTAGSDVPCGFYQFQVSPTTGGGANSLGLQNHRDDLTGNVNYLPMLVPLYPKDPSTPNVVEIRLPGAVDITEL